MRVFLAAVPLVFVALVAAAAESTPENSIVVDDAQQFIRAVRTANRNGGNAKIVLKDGTYTLSAGLQIRAPNISIVSQSGEPGSVTIEGDTMSPDAAIGNLITVMAESFVLDGITLQKSRFHLIQVKGESGADNFIARNCVLRDSYQQLLKVTAGKGKKRNPSENGIVENCLFEYSAGIGPQHYIGGIDAHGAQEWTVRNNTFRDIVSPGPSVAEYAVHFWNGSADNIVEKNTVINCDRGIGFGLGMRGNSRGIIRNNMIYHAANRGEFADVGIAIHSSPGTQIYNNTIYQSHKYPHAIEYRFPTTTDVLIANNLTNRSIRSIRDAHASLQNNITEVDAGVFPQLTSGDLHLASGTFKYIDRGSIVSGLIDDFDGEARPLGAGIDIGADEVPDASATLYNASRPEL